MSDGEIGFSQLGLAKILKQNRLVVPANQRDYSWTRKQVRTLFQDLARAISEGDKSYFLGTIVTIPRDNGVLEVVDGQQRLATTAIFLAQVRNYLAESEPFITKSIDAEFLNVIDRSSRASVPRIRLNLDDNDFFRARLNNDTPQPDPSKHSHELINDAFEEAAQHVSDIVASHNPKDHGDILNRWISFMEDRALAVLLRVPNDADAYRMFETLNDRGLRTSQSDLVKNYLFGRAGERVQEVQQRWQYMRGALETIEDDDITITFLRHALALISGFVRESEVYESVQRHAKAPQPVISFSTKLEELSYTYVAMHSSEHERWNEYAESTRNAIEVLNLFNIRPLRPLMLAIGHCFHKKEADKAFPFCVTLSVRLMIASSTRTGTVEEGLASSAHDIFQGHIRSTNDLRKFLSHLLPTDRTFYEAFKTATVSNRKLARYYLRSLELTAMSEKEPWHIPNDDRSVINLEHVLPEKPGGGWPQFSDDERRLYYKRIGNLCLMRASDNSAAKSDSFSDKKQFFKDSPYVLTREIAKHAQWTSAEISHRQERLADLAIQTWAL